MKVLLSLEFVSLDRAVEVARAVAPDVDWIEAGTPLIKRYGIECIRRLKEAVPDKTVIAAMKTIDTAAWEIGLAAEAGADIISVLGSASESTVAAAAETAGRLNRKIIADMVGISNLRVRASRISVRGVHYLQLRAPLEDTTLGAGLVEDLATVTAASELPVIVPGDVSAAVFERLRRFHPVAISVGRSILEDENVVGAAARVREMADQIRPEDE